MESQYFFEAPPPGNSYLTYLLSPPTPPAPIDDHWTVEENQVFERCIAELDHLSRDFFEKIAQRIPRKSVGQIHRHYEALVEDVRMIESGRVPIPDYDKSKRMVEQKKTEPSDEPWESKSTEEAPRRKGVPWNRDEHQMFLLGLEKYGRGDWKNISRNCVKTRNSTQVASHAQKYFKRLKNESDSRRYSRLLDPSTLPGASETTTANLSIYLPSLWLGPPRSRRIGHSLAYSRC